jgi:hypothetical protein
MNYQKNITLLLLQSLLSCVLIFSVSAAQKTVSVSGIVVDSASNQPISQATVGLFDTTMITIPNMSDTTSIVQMVTNMMNSGQIDTTTSASDGKISYSMKIASNSLVLLCGVFKQGYTFGYSISFLLPTANTVKLDTIKLSKIPDAALLPGKGMVPLQMKPTDIKVFSLDGRMLYSGPIGIFDKGMRGHHGVVLATLTAKGKCLVKNAKIALP